MPPRPRPESLESLPSLPSPIFGVDVTPGSLVVEVGDGSQAVTPVTSAVLEDTPGYATGRSDVSSLSGVAVETGSTLNVGFHVEPSRVGSVPADAGDETSPLPGYATAAANPDRIRQHPIFDLPYSTPANREINSDQPKGPDAPSGEVADSSSQGSGTPTGEVGASGIAISDEAMNVPTGRGAVADGPTPSASTANEVAFDSGPPGETYSRLPINRLGHQPSAEPHLYQDGPLYQQMAAALQSPQHGLNPKAKSRKGAKAMEPKYHPYNFRTNARGKTYDEDTESD